MSPAQVGSQDEDSGRGFLCKPVCTGSSCAFLTPSCRFDGRDLDLVHRHHRLERGICLHFRSRSCPRQSAAAGALCGQTRGMVLERGPLFLGHAGDVLDQPLERGPLVGRFGEGEHLGGIGGHLAVVRRQRG